jgi:hypothetical protein
MHNEMTASPWQNLPGCSGWALVSWEQCTVAGANAWEALAGGWQAAVLAELFDKMGDLAQALKV